MTSGTEVAVHDASVGLSATKTEKARPLRCAHIHPAHIRAFCASRIYSHIYPCPFEVPADHPPTDVHMHPLMAVLHMHSLMALLHMQMHPLIWYDI